MWGKIKAWCAREWEAVKKSGTVLLGWLSTAAGFVGAALVDLYQDPTVNTALQAALKPEYVPYYLIAFGLLIRFVRKRNATDL